MVIITSTFFFFFLIPLLLTVALYVDWSVFFRKSYDEKTSNKADTRERQRHPSLPDPSSDDFKKKVKKFLSYILMGIIAFVFGFAFYEAFLKEDPTLPPDVITTLQNWINTYYELDEYQQAGHNLNEEQKQSMHYHYKAFNYVMAADTKTEQLDRFNEIAGDPLTWNRRADPAVNQIVSDFARNQSSDTE